MKPYLEEYQNFINNGFDFSEDLYELFNDDLDLFVFIDPELKKTATVEKAKKFKDFLRAKRQQIVSALAKWSKRTGKNLLQVVRSSPGELLKAIAAAGIGLLGGLTWAAVLGGGAALLSTFGGLLLSEGIISDAIKKARGEEI